ncbi:hypothetical protein GE107_07790 [Cohnella sp. CFH 77786]|uniref:DinB family protein n=1 Tax=Cohnella sp. CFH 77786 TaxID=2662265 RepID=UPI001C60E030|nr:DinB family protein [Cohnella sp. CFH 77786]MBW5445960.1 hypothetical protein [Cohnella sp. CFH 77786]
MFKTIAEFTAEWGQVTEGTKRLFDTLTDDSLSQAVGPNRRTLGRLAAHIVTAPHEMMSRTGLSFETPLAYDYIPESGAEIAQAYRAMEQGLLNALRNQWDDAKLAEVSEMYGDEWPNGFTLRAVIHHEIHHRGQMTVLMRQAGLQIPGMYGPVMEDWEEWGMKAPIV